MGVLASSPSPLEDSAALAVLVKDASALLRGGMSVLHGQLAHSRKQARALSRELEAQAEHVRKAALYKKSAERALVKLSKVLGAQSNNNQGL